MKFRCPYEVGQVVFVPALSANGKITNMYGNRIDRGFKASEPGTPSGVYVVVNVDGMEHVLDSGEVTGRR